MGLSVISKIASTPNTATSAPQTDAPAGLPGEFAALLSGQTLAALLTSNTGTAAQPGTLATPKGATQEESGSTPLADLTTTPAIDPAALVALMGNPHIQTAITSRAPAGQEFEQSADSTEKKSGLADTLLGSTQQNNSPRDQSAASLLPAAGNTATTAPGAAEKSSLADTANIAVPTESTGNPPSFSANLATAVHHQTAASNSQATVSTPLHSAAWPQQFSEKIVWMAKNDQQSAQINLNPPQLGPVQITLNLNGDQATAVFASPHAEVRQAIESSLPQLRDMLSTAGIALGDANVGANLAQQNPNNAFQTPNRAQSSLENAILPANDNAPVAGIAAPLHQGRGLVDLFA